MTCIPKMVGVFGITCLIIAQLLHYALKADLTNGSITFDDKIYKCMELK